jgi:hypothetical protein
MRHNLGKAPSFQRLRGPDTDIDCLPPILPGAPVPSETMKSGSSTSGKIAVTSESAEIRGLFWRGPASWNVPTPSIFLGGKNLLDIISYIKALDGGDWQTQVLRM